MDWEEFVRGVVENFNCGKLGNYLGNNKITKNGNMHKDLPLTKKWYYMTVKGVDSVPSDVLEELRNRWNIRNSKLYKVLE